MVYCLWRLGNNAETRKGIIMNKDHHQVEWYMQADEIFLRSIFGDDDYDSGKVEEYKKRNREKRLKRKRDET